MKKKALAVRRKGRGPLADDGRVARRLENRTRIVDALLSLIRSGRTHPTLSEIAAKAGVTSRTLLNHFPDTRALLRAAAARAREGAEARLPRVPDNPDSEARIREFFRRASRFFDGYASIRWATLTFPSKVPGFDPRQAKSIVLGMVESRVAELLEGYGLTLSRDLELRRAVLMTVDPLAWRLLRVQQGLSRGQAAATVAYSVIALARDRQRSPRRRR